MALFGFGLSKLSNQSFGLTGNNINSTSIVHTGKLITIHKYIEFKFCIKII